MLLDKCFFILTINRQRIPNFVLYFVNIIHWRQITIKRRLPIPINVICEVRFKLGVISVDRMSSDLVRTLLELLLGEHYLPYLEDEREYH